jgi:tRNA(fMet)-specific endonuclease VapC
VRIARDNAIKQGAKLVIPPFVNYEILRGFYYQSAPKREAVYKKMRDNYAIGEMTTTSWEKAAEIYASMRRAGYTIGDADILIAAYCLVSSCTLVTNNSKDFANVGSLILVDWTK